MMIWCRNCHEKAVNWVENNGACNICRPCYLKLNQIPTYKQNALADRLSQEKYWFVSDACEHIAFRAVTQQSVIEGRLQEVIRRLMGGPPKDHLIIYIKDIIPNEDDCNPVVEVAVEVWLYGVKDSMKSIRLYPLDLVEMA